MSQYFPSTSNRILRALEPNVLEALEVQMVEVALDLKMFLEEPGKAIPFVYFVERGIVSVVATTREDRRIEAGLIGVEGMTGLAVVLGDDRSPNQTYVQAAGSARRIATEDLRAAMETHPGLARLLLRYAQAFLVQTTQTALANGIARIEERLSRWLLMAQDRTGERELPLTHEFLSIMLGVRRPGVTDTLHALEGRGLIRSTRGLVRIIDRDGLIAAADGSYGVPEAEYERLFA